MCPRLINCEKHHLSRIRLLLYDANWFSSTRKLKRELSPLIDRGHRAMCAQHLSSKEIAIGAVKHGGVRVPPGLPPVIHCLHSHRRTYFSPPPGHTQINDKSSARRVEFASTCRPATGQRRLSHNRVISSPKQES